MSYLHWDEKTLTGFSDPNIESMYDNGYVFTRLGKGIMHQTRSARIDLAKFDLSSENRRILKKCSEFGVSVAPIPFPGYDWSIGKMAKDFYSSRDAEFSANKVKELLTDVSRSNFDLLLIYQNHTAMGYAICHDTPHLLHYSYPFYDLSHPKDTGLGMMIQAILWAKDAGKKYMYIGSLQRPSDTYKLQFSGFQWFDGTNWNSDTEAAKKVLA